MNEAPKVLRIIKLKNIIILSLIILVISHLTFTQYSYVNSVTMVLGILVVSIIIYVNSIAKNDIFTFILLIYIGSHFANFMPGAGGLFSIVVFIIYIFFYSRINRKKDLYVNDKPTRLMIGVLVISNILGLIIKSPVPLYQLGLGIITFFSYIIIFNIVSHLKLSDKRIKLFVEIVSIFAIYNLVISLNTYLNILNINSPLIISSVKRYTMEANYQSGMFGSSEIYGEYALLSFLLLFPFYFYKNRGSKLLSINKILINLGIFASILNALLSFSKSIFILVIVGSFLIVFFINSKKDLSFAKSGKILLGILGIAVIISVSLTFLPLDYIFVRMGENTNFIENIIENPITGEGTSRELAFTLGLQRLSDEPWLIGYGWSVGSGNKMAWFGGSLTGWAELRADPHSLYYAIVPIFGWFGSFAFIFLIIRTIIKLKKSIKENRKKYSLLSPFLIGIFFLLIFFLIGEYKMNATRIPGYFMMVWIWIGLGVSAIKTTKTMINK